MSTSYPIAKEDEHDLDTSVSHVANEEESQAAIEEEIQLHIQESCTGVVLDNMAGEGGETDGSGVDMSTEEKIVPPKSDGQETDTSTNRLSRWTYPNDSSYSQEEAKVGLDVIEDNNVNVIQDESRAPSCAGLTANPPDSSNSKERNGEVATTGHLNSRSEHVSLSRDFVDQLEPLHSNASIEVAVETFGGEDCEPPLIAGNLHSRVFEDGQKSKQDGVVETLDGVGNDDPPIPPRICFADATITEKWAEVKAAVDGIEAEQSASSILPPTLLGGADYQTQDHDLRHQEVVEQLRDSNISPPIIEGLPNLPMGYSNTLSRSVSIQHVSEEEETEGDILIPEAVPVQANSPTEDQDVGVAQVVEPDHSMMSLKKRHAFLISLLIATTVIALGLTITFTRGDAPSNESLEASFPLPPSPKPSLVPLSAQRSLSIRNEIEKNVLQRNVTFDEMEATNNRVLALDWITNKDQMRLDSSDSNLFQRYILVLLAFEFSNSGWLSYSNECNWVGVECDLYGHVIKVESIDVSLDGTLPPEIGGLQHLQALVLKDNFLSGTLPSELGNLKDLWKLSLDRNNFTSTLPTELGNLKELIELTMNQNEFTGTLPLELGNLTKLARLSLNRNLLGGTLPSELGTLKDLTALHLRLNEFTGTIPSEFRNLQKLREFYFNRNQLTGTFPSELLSLSNLTRIYAHFNQFTGTVPSELGNLRELDRLILDGNQFTGTIPSELSNLRKLTELWLYDNRLTGTLPSELGNLEEIDCLVISQNQFTGTLPTEIGRLQKLTYVRFNENQFTGTLPTELAELKALNELYLFTNQFSGTIPSVLQHLTLLEAFSIYSNQFTGTLPSWLGTLNKLEILYVSANQFTGTLPSELGNLSELTRFGVDLNKFTGTVPSWIGDLRDLSILWLDGNQFTGTFPSEIENNLDLRDFCIRNNNFTGSLPAEIQTDWDCAFKV